MYKEKLILIGQINISDEVIVGSESVVVRDVRESGI